MGNPAYDARREAERAEAEKHRQAAVTMTAALEGIAAFFSGRASIVIGKTMTGQTTLTFERR